MATLSDIPKAEAHREVLPFPPTFNEDWWSTHPHLHNFDHEAASTRRETSKRQPTEPGGIGD